jgi:hypothetical protein
MSLTTEIEFVRFVKPGDQRPDEVEVPPDKVKNYYDHYIASIQKLHRETEAVMKNCPTAERTLCVTRTEKLTTKKETP